MAKNNVLLQTPKRSPQSNKGKQVADPSPSKTAPILGPATPSQNPPSDVTIAYAAGAITPNTADAQIGHDHDSKRGDIDTNAIQIE